MMKFIEFPVFWNQHKILCGTTTRSGGVSLPPFDSLNPGPSLFDLQKPMDENRNLIAQKIGWEREKMVFPMQVHSDHLVVIAKADSGRGSFDHEDGIPDTDALYTEEPGLLLCVVTADCHPLLIADSKRAAVAAVHTGWKGAFAGIASKVVKKFLECGSKPEDLIIAHGPGIESCCYGVSEDFQDLWVKKNSEYKRCFTLKNGQPYFDLRFAIDLELRGLKIKEENLGSLANCTCCHKEDFYSYRRDGERTGRMLNFIGIRK